MTLKSGTSQACAVCKYQRRKCTPECQLAPYFPPDNPKMFLNAHKLFGVSNILKILKDLDSSQKAEAMTSIIYQSNIRARYPVRGCVEIIRQCVALTKQYEHEMQIVRSLLAMSHNQISSNDSPSQLQLGITPFHPSSPHPHPQTDPFAQAYVSENYSYSSNSNNNGYNSGYGESNENIVAISHNQIQSKPNLDDSTSQLQLGITPFHSSPPPPPPPPADPFAQAYVSENYSYSSNSNNVYNSGYAEPNENVVANSVWIQQPYKNNDHHTSGLIPVESQTPKMHHEEVLQEYDEMKPYFDSSPESSMTDTLQSIEHVAENELKTAAACFSLTSVN